MTTTSTTVAPEEDLLTGQKADQGRTTIYDAVSERLADDPSEPNIWRAKIHMGGASWLAARVMAARELLLEDDSDTAKADSIIEMARVGNKPFSGLFVTEMGAYVQEGRIGAGNTSSELAMFPKGVSRKYFKLEKGVRWPLAATRGYGGTAALAEHFARTLSHVPRTCEVTKERLEAIPEYDSNYQDRAIQAVYLHTFPGFGDGPTYGCLWLVTDRQPADEDMDGILNGYLWVPADSGLEAEHGSFYQADVQRRRFGQLVDYVPGSFKFSDCWNLPPSRTEAYRAVLGLDHHQE